MRGNLYLKLFVGISICLAIYLYYIKWDRTKSIEKYFDHPKVGDVYKIEKNTGDGTWLSYYKVRTVSDEKIEFSPSKMKSDASVDYILNHFQNDEIITYSFSDLKEIREGRWNNFQKDNTVLVEIIRKEQ